MRIGNLYNCMAFFFCSLVYRLPMRIGNIAKFGVTDFSIPFIDYL